MLTFTLTDCEVHRRAILQRDFNVSTRLIESVGREIRGGVIAKVENSIDEESFEKNAYLFFIRRALVAPDLYVPSLCPLMRVVFEGKF